MHAVKEQKILITSRIPTLGIMRSAFQTQQVYVDCADTEVAWMGAVSEVDDKFIIEEMFLLEQTVSGVRAHIDPVAHAKLMEKLYAERGLKFLEKIRYWGHSHVDMDTDPSPPDEAQLQKFGAKGNPWFIRGIFNKNGEADFTVALFKQGLRIEHARFEVLDPPDRALRRAVRRQLRRFLKAGHPRRNGIRKNVAVYREL